MKDKVTLKLSPRNIEIPSNATASLKAHNYMPP